MATYEYICDACGLIREVKHSMTLTPEIACNSCGNIMHKHLTAKTTGVTRKTGDKQLSDWEEVKMRHK
ncbi:MAG: zinc ribbon domain-containing protein [Candidatus Thorarchaeota archaeon]